MDRDENGREPAMTEGRPRGVIVIVPPTVGFNWLDAAARHKTQSPRSGSVRRRTRY